jgi:hypothetical protein
MPYLFETKPGQPPDSSGSDNFWLGGRASALPGPYSPDCAFYPAPLTAAGVDVTRVAGWTLAKVPVMDSRGKAVAVDKLLKPFNL